MLSLPVSAKPLPEPCNSEKSNAKKRAHVVVVVVHASLSLFLSTKNKLFPGWRPRRAHHLARRVGRQAAGRARRPCGSERDRHGLPGDGGESGREEEEETISMHSFFFFLFFFLDLLLDLSQPRPSLFSFSLSLLLSKKHNHDTRATSRPRPPSPRSPAPSPAPTSPPRRGATPSGRRWRGGTSRPRSPPSTTPTRRSWINGRS